MAPPPPNAKPLRPCPLPAAGLPIRKLPFFWNTLFASPIEFLSVIVAVLLPVRQALGYPPFSPLDNNVLMVLLMQHLVLDSWRVQLIPFYIGVVFLGSRSGNTLTQDIIQIGLAAVSLVFCVILPANIVPMKPRGRYAVATVLEHIKTPVAKTTTTAKVDPPKTGIERVQLECSVQVYMPVEKAAISRAPFTPMWGTNRSVGSEGPPYTFGSMQRILMRHTLVVFLSTAAVLGQMTRFDLTYATEQYELLYGGVMGRLGQYVDLEELGLGGAVAGLGTEEVVRTAEEEAKLDTAMTGLAVVAVMLLVALVQDVLEARSRFLFRAIYLPHGHHQIQGLAKANDVNSLVWHPLTRLRSAAYDGAYLIGEAPVFPLAKKGGKFPVVMLFHGIKSPSSLYSTYAAEWASHGYVVLVPDSNDGAASASVLPISDDSLVMNVRLYEKPPPEDDPTAYTFRAIQLERRMREVALVMDHLDLLGANTPQAANSNGTAATNKAVLNSKKDKQTRKFSSSAPAPAPAPKVVSDFKGMAAMGCDGQTLDLESIALVGHSYGGATVLRIAQLSETKGHVIHPRRIKLVASLDPWFFPMPREGDDRYTDAIKDFKMATPLMVVSNKDWHWKTNYAKEHALVSASEQSVNAGKSKLCLHMQMLHSGHCNMSDIGLFAPLVARKLKTTGDVDPVTYLDVTSELVLAGLYAFTEEQPDTKEKRWVDLLTGQGIPPNVAEATLARGRSPPFPPN